ncbi:cilia- and flagella-associated protein 77 [Cololabis saira]|uniref:cilia- and flagella-associated protein 77 n=1 Tax=Cololabis saira TaxID=129043 RepID=UPI002AD55227|nr:cilia- and flagella-associated protein 77 [Cololabis saira]
MAYPRGRVVRDSLLTSITKAPVGKARSSSGGLPGPDFTYGKPSDLNQVGGVAEALSSWKVEPRREEPPPLPNYVSLNRDVVKSGLVTSKEMKQYRVQRQEAAVQNRVPRQREGRASRRRPPLPDIVFGVASRLSTIAPMADILSHEYGQRWADEHLSQTCSRKKKVQVKPAETRTSLLRRSTSLPVVHKPFKLPQFTEVAPALDTFRDPKARERALRASRAFRARQSTSLSRTEHQGPGTNGQD